MCEWIIIVAQRIASVMGFNDPAAKGATVKGMRAADTSLQQNCQKLFKSNGDFIPAFQTPNDSSHV